MTNRPIADRIEVDRKWVFSEFGKLWSRSDVEKIQELFDLYDINRFSTTASLDHVLCNPYGKTADFIIYKGRVAWRHQEDAPKGAIRNNRTGSADHPVWEIPLSRYVVKGECHRVKIYEFEPCPDHPHYDIKGCLAC
jgi:hypothetical protein